MKTLRPSRPWQVLLGLLLAMLAWLPPALASTADHRQFDALQGLSTTPRR
ncbi:hypothetical protein [Halomonas sp. E19]